VLGGVSNGGSTDIKVTRPDGVESVGSVFDASFIYPGSTRLPGGGNAVMAYVAEEAGWYTVSTAADEGRYGTLLEVYRPGSEVRTRGVVQTIFLDFNGERVNTGIWGGPGVRTLSPFSAFLGRWGLTNANRNAVINRVIATVRENIRADLASGPNRNFAVRILNSRDHADPFGQEDVSRVVVGGTIAQSGIPTIGIAESIDPGNFESRESALVLLDVLSGPAEPWDPQNPSPSLNSYITPASNKVQFVGTAIGNVVAHEIGHYIGNFHVDQFNTTLNLMDQGGNFPLLYGVGQDRVGGTADDADVDFGEDTYNPFEGFIGIEDTRNNGIWAFVRGQH
jgi:hypothetical protein